MLSKGAGRIAGQSESDSGGQNILKKKGDYWHVVYKGNNVGSVQHSKGMAYIACLLSRPKRDFNAVDLYRANNKAAVPGRSIRNEQEYDQDDMGENKPAGRPGPEPIADRESLEECRKELQGLRAELERAKQNNDEAEQNRVQDQIDELGAQLKLLTRPDGKNGTPRTFINDSTRAKDAVDKAIKRAIKHIAKYSKDLERHLTNTIKTGSVLAYQPDEETVWQTD